MSWLWDPVFAIREAAVNNLKELTIIFGSDWAQREILDRLLNQSDRIDEEDKIDYSNFIIRITCLFAITSLIPVIDYKVLVDKVLPFINSLITDSVPNIRFNVAKSYLTLVEALTSKKVDLPIKEEELKKLINLEILSNLEKLENDDDVDVRFYSTKSIKCINEILA